MLQQPQQGAETIYYSDQFEPQCPLCQSGEHTTQTESGYAIQSHQAMGQAFGQAARGRVVYTTPERIVSQTIIEGVALSPLQVRQQMIQTPPQIIPRTTQVVSTPPVVIQNSPQIVQRSPIVVQQPIQPIQKVIIPQQQQIIAPQQQFAQTKILNQQIGQFTQQQQIQDTQNLQITQQLKQSQLIQQELLLKQQELNSKFQMKSEEMEQKHQEYLKLQSAYQEQLEAYEALKTAYEVTTKYQATNFIPSFLQTVTYKAQGQNGKVYNQEEIELYWRHKVYELESQMYSLWEKINEQKQKKESGFRNDDTDKIEKLQIEVTQLEHILRLKQNSIVMMRNKLNDLMYQFDPATEATRDQDLELQSLRQKVMQLSSKYTEIQDEIQMSEASNEAIRSGKNIKFVQVKQTTSSVRQVTNSVRGNQIQEYQ